MILNQISIFIENKSGRVADILSKLESNGISIKALCLADTAHFGILRMIVEDSDAAMEKIRGLNMAASSKSVLCVRTQGSCPLSMILSVLTKAGLFVEYMYTMSSGQADPGSVIVCVNDEEGGEAALRAAGIADA